MPIIDMKYIPFRLFNPKKDEGPLSITLCRRGDLRVVVKAARAGSATEVSLLREAANNLLLQPSRYVVLMNKMVKAYDNMSPLIHHTLDPNDIMDRYSYIVSPYEEGSMSLMDFLLFLLKNSIRISFAAQISIVL
jgi:hypothetical protein